MDEKKNNNPSSYKIALKIAFLYGIIGLAWIWVTDWLIFYVINNSETITIFQSYKGFFYVLGTSLLLFYLIKKNVKQITNLNSKIVNQNQKLQSLHQKTHQLAYYDSLTDIPNQEKFKEELSEKLKNNKNIGIALFDIDNVKRINSIYGVEYGDAVLKNIAVKLEQTSSGENNIARIEGDIFAIFEKDINNLNNLKTFVENLQKSFTGAISFQKHTFHTTITLGAVLAPIHGKSADILLTNAENALHHAKQKNRTSYSIYKPELKKKYYQHLNREVKINTALENDDFCVYYQPIVESSSGEIAALEALIRWFDDGTLIPPDDFIPFAQKSGQIFSIDRWVINQCCFHHQSGFFQNKLNDVFIHINLSAQEFENREISKEIKKIINRYSISYDKIRLEITESRSVKDLYQCSETIKKLREIGIKCALDDFGTGYSSLSYLTDLSIDFIKLDLDLVTGIDSDKTKQEIAKNIIKMAHCLDIEIIAEGVETKEEFEFLTGINCDYIQGFYISAPKSIEDLLAQPTEDSYNINQSSTQESSSGG